MKREGGRAEDLDDFGLLFVVNNETAAMHERCIVPQSSSNKLLCGCKIVNLILELS